MSTLSNGGKIYRQRSAISLSARLRCATWLPILESERELQLGQYYGPYNGRYNMSGRRAYQRRRNVDIVLREHGYRPDYRDAPPSCGPIRSAPPTPTSSAS
jgi:hypothetical protein